MKEKKILLVEDNFDDEVLTIRAFKKNNILNEIVVVRDGAEALDYLFCKEKYAKRQITDLPEIVLLDLKLPKVSGHEVLAEIRKNELTHLLPVVVMTTSNEEDDKLRSYENGANSFIRKPVDFDQFSDAIKQLGGYWLVLNEGPH